ncbi:MAG: chemotaxis protein CheW [Anaerolineales bacterium]|nr:chemotaxis protein CheW [Anaerolineales bacterium]
MTAADRAQAVLADRARALARVSAPVVETTAVGELAAFHLGAEYLGVPTIGVREIQPLRAHRWARIPCAPAFVVGLVNLRGRLYSILDLAAFWGRPARRPAETAHLLVVRGGRGAEGEGALEVALLTDAVPHVVSVPVAGLEPPPATVSARALEHLRGVTADALMVVDLERLLGDPQLIVFDEP